MSEFTDTQRLDWVLKHGAEFIMDGDANYFLRHNLQTVPEWRIKKARRIIDSCIDREAKR